MEQRIATNRKLNRRLTERDRLEFGRELLMVMAETVLKENPVIDRITRCFLSRAGFHKIRRARLRSGPTLDEPNELAPS